jgi:tape measure domain-containing protein
MEGADEEVSNEVDKHIVEMEFKNAEFEKNASKTLSTLEALRAKLRSNFSTKAAEDLNKSIKSIDVSPVVKGLETVQLQFSALQIAGKRIIENITDAAMRGIADVKNKLTGVLNLIKTGGANRAQNIEQAKFMLKGFGIEWSQIEADINYGVQDTAYGLDAAAKVASQLVASNIQMGDDMRQALRGISGVAAMTNSTYEDIGRIFTQVAGQGRLMGDQLLQLSGRGINAAATLAKSINVTEAEVRDMVSKGKIDFNTFAKAMDDAFGEHAKDANNTFSGALSNTRAALSRLGADIQTQKFETFRVILLKVTAKLKELKKAIKPVEDGIKSAMDAVGKLVEYLIERVNITGMVESLAPKILKVTDTIKNFANTAKSYIQELDNSKPVNFIDNLTKTAETVKEIVEFTQEEIDLAKRIWETGEGGNGEERVRYIESLGEKYKNTQAAVDKFIESGYNWDALVNKTASDTGKAVDAVNGFVGPINSTKTKPSGIYLIIDSLHNGFRVIKNIAGSGKNLLKVIFNSLNGTFGDHSLLEGVNGITSKIADLSDKLYISEKRASKGKPIFDALFTVLKFGAKIVVSAAKGIGNIALVLANIINKARDSKLVKGLLEAIGNAIKGIITGVTNLYTKLRESDAWNKIINTIKTIGIWLGEKIIDSLNLFGTVASKIGDGVVPIFEKLVGHVKSIGEESEKGHPWLEKIKEFFTKDALKDSWLTRLKDTLKDIFCEGKDTFQAAFNKGSDFINGLISGLKNISEDDLEKIVKLLGNVALTISTIRWLYSMTKVNKSFSDMTKGFTEVFEALNITIKKYGKRADADRFKMFATSIAIIVGSFIALMAAFAALEYYNFDVDSIYKKVLTVVGLTTLITGIVMVLVSWLEKAKDINQVGNKTFNVFSNMKTPTFALVIFSFAYFLKTIIQAIMTLYRVSQEDDFSIKKVAVISGVIAAVLTLIGVFAGFAIKFSKNTNKISGLATTMLGMAILIRSLVGSFKTVLKAVKNAELMDVAEATGIIEALMIPLLVFGAGVVAITSFAKQSAMTSNPFKGMMGMFIGLAVMLRVGLVPLLNAIYDVRKKGSKGTAAINDLKSILKGILIFIGIVVGLLAVLDRFVSYGGKEIGTEFVDGKMVGAVTGGGFNTSSKGGLIWGVVGIIGALAAMFAAIGYVVKKMKGVDASSLETFKSMTTTLMVIIGILATLAGVASAVPAIGQGVTAGLLALAAVIAAMGVAMVGAGYGFKAFETGLRELINSLPDMIDSLLNFFKKVKDQRQEIIDGIGALVTTFLEGITVAFVSWAKGWSKAIPIMVATIFDSIIVTLNSVADQFLTRSDEVIDAADRFAMGILYFLSLAVDKVRERGKGLFGDIIGHLLVENMNPMVRDMLGWDIEDFEYTGPDPEELRAEMEEKGKTSAQYFYDTYYAGMAQGIDEYSAPDNGLFVEKILENGFDTSNMPNWAQGLLGDKVEDVNKYLKNNFTNKLTLGEINIDDITQGMMGDMDAINEKMGVTFNPDVFQNMFEGVDLSDPDALNQALDAIEGFDFDSDAIMADWSDDMTEYGSTGFSNFTEGMEKKEEQVQQMATQISDNLVDKLESYEPKMYVAGKYLLDGFNAGLADEEGTRTTYKNVAEMVRSARRKLEEEAEIHSPSRVFMRLGRFVTLGFAEGIGNTIGAATQASKDTGEAAIMSMRETIKRMSLEAADTLDASPRITPVLDMSNLTQGMNEINGMFDTTRSYKLGAITSTEANAATSRKVNAVYQNGSGFDDSNTVASINSLRGELAGLKDSISGMQVVMDGRALVGQIATPMDKALGKKVLAGRRSK